MGGGGSKPRYRGATLNGVPEGHGRMVWSDGRKYEGVFSQGLMHGYGAMKMPNGDTYDGEWRDGSRHGQGVFTFAEGTYNGLWAKGLMDGDGMLTLKVGTTYSGGFKKHKYDGNGVLKLAGGDKYTGGFRNGLYDGHGFLKMADGSMYDGGFKNGDVHGHGRWFSPGNWLYDGMFEQGIPFEGEMTMFNGKVYFTTYDVSQKCNELGFRGERVKPTEETLIGQYVAGWDGNRDCTGTVRFEWADGRVFQGELVDGCPTKGKLIDIEKTLWDVEYDGKTLITQDHLKPIRQTLSAVEVEKDRLFFMQMERIEKRIAQEEESFQEMRKAIEEELQRDEIVDRANKENTVPLSTDDPNISKQVLTAEGLEEAKSEAAADTDTDAKPSATSDDANESAAETRPPSVEASEAPASPPPPELPVKEASGVGGGPDAGSEQATVHDGPKPERIKSNLMKRVEMAKPLIDRVEARERDKIDQQKPTWKSQAKVPKWYPQMEGFGSFTGQLDLGAAMEYRKQLQAKTNAEAREQERKESRGGERSTKAGNHSGEDGDVPYQFPHPDELQSRIAELVAMLYSGEERKGEVAPAVTLSGHDTLGTKKVILQEMQEKAARELLWMLGGQVKGSLDHERWWTTVDEKLIKTENRKRVDLTARYLNMDGGMKALVHVLRSERYDQDLATVFKASKEIDQPALILGYGPCAVDVREIAAQCVAIGSVINLSNGVKLRMKTHPHRPEGDGVYALVDLLGRGPDGVRERAADSLARLCAASTTLRADAVSYKGVLAILKFFSDEFSCAYRIQQARILVASAEARKLRASAAASEEMQDNLMRMAQEELEERLVVVKALEFRLKRMKETAFVALCALTEDSPDAATDVLENGGLALLVSALADSSLSWRAVEAATGALSNVCRSLLIFDPGQRHQDQNASQQDEANGAGWHQVSEVDSSRERSADVDADLSLARAKIRLLCDVDATMGVAALCSLLNKTKDNDELLLVSTRALSALAALTKDNEQVGATVFENEGVELFLFMFKYGQDASKWYLKKSAIPVQVPYVTREALKARETAVGALGALLKVNSLAVDKLVAMHGVPRLIQLLSLGDDMSFEDSTPTLAMEALYQAMKGSQNCITEARRCGIREVIASIKASPLLRSPNDQQRQQAEWVAQASEHMITLLNSQPQEGESFTARGVAFDVAIIDVLRIQAMWKRARARIRARDLRRLSGPTRASILRLEEAKDDEAQFQKFCSVKSVPGQRATAEGQVSTSMNSFEFIDLLRHISVFGHDASDRHKVTKTQAITAFKNASQAGESGRHRLRNGRAELFFSDFQTCIRSCIRILLSVEQVDMRGTIFDPQVPASVRSSALAQGTAWREVEKRINPSKALVGTKSVINFLMHPTKPAQ